MSTEAQRRSKATAAAAIARALAHVPPAGDKAPDPAPTAPPIDRPLVTTTTGPYQLTPVRAKQIRYEIEERRRNA